ncbi:MAG: hypothetical protein AB1757_06765 [Acidobacteriota bacterium]
MAKKPLKQLINNHMNEDIQPYGLLVRDPLPGQAVYNRIFAGGIGSGESFNWKPFLPPRERQYRIPFCVAFSRTNCAEAKGRKEGIDINLSDRELGVISGTTQQGNYMDTVSEFFRQKGITLEKDVPFTDAMLNLSTPNAWADIFNLPDTTEKKRYKGGNFSWVYGLGAMIDALNYSPLQIAVGIGSNWESNGPIGAPAKITAYHAVTLYHIDSQGNKYIQDSIGKEWKILKPDYPLTGTLSFRDLPEDWKDNMARVIREPNGTIRIELGIGDKKVNIGINEANFANKIAQSGEPIIDVPAPSPSKQIGVIEPGLVIDSE